MKVVELHAENFKRLKAVTIRPVANTVVVSGANEQGKTSVLDSIFWVLSGGTMTKATGTKTPIRTGTKKAVVSLDLGDMIATRKATASGDTLTVEGKDGSIFKSPQSVLDALVGKIAIDPLSFANSSDKEQKETLLKMVDLGFCLKDHEDYRSACYNDRQSCGREVKRFEGVVASLPGPAAGDPTEEVRAEAIIEEIRAADLTNRNNADKRNHVRFIKNTIEENKRKIDELQNGLKVLEGELMIAEGEIDGLKDIDVTPLESALANASTINERVRSRKTFEQATKRLDDERARYAEFSKMLEGMDKKKTEAMEKATFPVPGLGFDETGVTFKSVPFSQCSSAERLRVSVAVAMAANPRLRVIRITDGSLIDSRNMAILEEMAIDADYQIWIEKVDETGKVGICIEDGEVREGSK